MFQDPTVSYSINLKGNIFMSGSTFGNNITVTTWGESHGIALGCVVDGFPAGMELDPEDVQKFLDRRKPGTSGATTTRKEDDLVEILSGVSACSAVFLPCSSPLLLSSPAMVTVGRGRTVRKQINPLI